MRKTPGAYAATLARAAWIRLGIGDGPGLSAALREAFAAERSRGLLLTPVPFASGIAGYFALPVEPPAVLTGFSVVTVLAGLVLARAHMRLVLLAPALLVAGFALAQARTAWVSAPILSETLRAVTIEATVVQVEPMTGDDLRLILEPLSIERLGAGDRPARLRVSVRIDAAGVTAGDSVRLLATLEPPPEPVAPYAFDFARQAFFERLGAVGYALSPVERLTTGSTSSVWQAVHDLRARVAARVRQTLPEPEGGIAAALLTGLRGGIAKDDAQAMRDSGLAHLLAISGLHIGLVTATAFFLVRAALAANPVLALRLDLKKLAAGAAWLVALGYLLLAGATVPTQRAFLMATVVLFALLIGRQPVSLRLVAFAAFVVLALAPEALLSASFQMSFAAVVALVAAYEALAPRIARWRRRAGEGLPRRLSFYFLGVILTTLIAEAAIAPFAAFHFNRVTHYGLLANLVAVPAMAFLVMPLGLLALILMPLGLEALGLVPMGWGIDIVLAAAHQVANLPGAARAVQAFSAEALGLGALGALWLLLWRRWRLKLIGLPALAAGVAMAASHRPPDLLVSRDADLFGVDRAEAFYVSSLSRARYTREQWTRRAGEEDAALWTRKGAATRANPESRISPPVRCDALGCVMIAARGERRRAPVLVSVAKTAEALETDCRRADILLSAVPVRIDCPGPDIIVDRFSVWREGAHALWLGRAPPRVLSVAAARGDRPWTRRREGPKDQ